MQRGGVTRPHSSAEEFVADGEGGGCEGVGPWLDSLPKPASKEAWPTVPVQLGFGEIS